MRRPSRLWVAAALLALAGVTGCSTSNLEFTQDNRLHFTSPKSRQLVNSPVTLTWRMSDFDVVQAGSSPPTSHAGYFAIFLDRAPVKPGQKLDSLADKSCLQTPGCYNAEYLANRNVYTTSSYSFRISEIPQLNSYSKVELHEVTIVLLNSAGQRIGESAWYLDFRLRSQGV